MSIPAKMKFIVRGKSVDFKNREGSSPSIPKKTIWLPNSFFFFFILFSLAVQNSLSFSFTTLYTMSGKSHVIYMIHVQMNIFEQGMESPFD